LYYTHTYTDKILTLPPENNLTSILRDQCENLSAQVAYVICA